MCAHMSRSQHSKPEGEVDIADHREKSSEANLESSVRGATDNHIVCHLTAPNSPWRRGSHLDYEKCFKMNKKTWFFTCMANQCAKAFTRHCRPHLELPRHHDKFANFYKTCWEPWECCRHCPTQFCCLRTANRWSHGRRAPSTPAKPALEKCFVLVFVYNYMHFQRIQSSPLDSWWGWPSNSSQYCAASWNRTSTASKQTLSWSCLAFCCPWIWSTMKELYCGRFNLIERENSPAVPESSLPAFLSPEQIVLCQHPPVPALILLICTRWSPLTAKDSWGQ